MKGIVVGAGLSGLTAAYELRKAGWDVTVLEAGSYAGGRSATHMKDGYEIDTGASTITSGYTEYIRLLREVGLSDHLQPCTNLIGTLRGGRIYEVDGSNPLSGPLSPLISLRSKFKLVNALIDKISMRPKIDYLNISNSYRYDTESLASYSARRLNKEIHDYLATPLLRGNFIRDPDQATKLEWFAMLSNFTGQQLYGVRGGIQTLPKHLASLVDVRLNSAATYIKETDRDVLVRWVEGGTEHTANVDGCIVTTQLPDAVRICPDYGNVAGELNSQLRYSRSLLVHLGFRKRTESKVIGVLIPTVEHRDICLLWLEHNKLPQCTPPGHSLITVYFDDEHAKDCYDKPDEELIATSRDYLVSHFPELHGQMEMSHISRWPRAIVYPKPGVYTEVHKLRQRLAQARRLHFAGDYFACAGQNTAIHYGTLAAKALLTAGESGSSNRAHSTREVARA